MLKSLLIILFALTARKHVINFPSEKIALSLDLTRPFGTPCPFGLREGFLSSKCEIQKLKSNLNSYKLI